MRMAYLDNGATTQVCEAAAEKAKQLMCECFGNPASVHSLGILAEQEVTAARKVLAHRLGCQPAEIVFTSGGTESNNLAILGSAVAACRRGNKVITSAVEHPSVLKAVKALEERGFETVILPVDTNGCISLSHLEKAIDDNTVLVSVMLVNNETGAIQPVEEIASLLKRKRCGALLHTDCVQAFGKYPFSVQKLQADLLTISGHKIHAPKGVGALYVRKGVRLVAQTYGGGQEAGLRSGTVAVSQIGAMAAAVKAMPSSEQAHEQAVKLRTMLLAGIEDIDGVFINSRDRGSPFIVNLSVPGIPSEVMIRALEEDQVYVSGGSACAKGARSHVLAAQGIAPDRIDSALRISFSYHTSQQDIQQFLQAFHKACRILHRKR